jgi:hypothetical protein
MSPAGSAQFAWGHATPPFWPVRGPGLRRSRATVGRAGDAAGARAAALSRLHRQLNHARCPQQRMSGGMRRSQGVRLRTPGRPRQNAG